MAIVSKRVPAEFFWRTVTLPQQMSTEDVYTSSGREAVITAIWCYQNNPIYFDLSNQSDPLNSKKVFFKILGSYMVLLGIKIPINDEVHLRGCNYGTTSTSFAVSGYYTK